MSTVVLVFALVGLALLALGFGLAGRAGQVAHLISATAFFCGAVVTLTGLA